MGNGLKGAVNVETLSVFTLGSWERASASQCTVKCQFL